MSTPALACDQCDFTTTATRYLTRHRNATHNPAPGIDLPPPGPWVRDALCAQTDPDLFHPDGKGRGVDGYAQARKVCVACPVRRECLDYALTVPTVDDHGMWGGTTPMERAALRAERNAA